MFNALKRLKEESSTVKTYVSAFFSIVATPVKDIGNEEIELSTVQSTDSRILVHRF